MTGLGTANPLGYGVPMARPRMTIKAPVTISTIDTVIDGLYNDNANAAAESKSVLSSNGNTLSSCCQSAGTLPSHSP